MRTYRSGRVSSVVVERESVRRQKELAQQSKAAAKLDEATRARLAVAEYDNQLEVLLSLHQSCAPAVDWLAFASALRPVEPVCFARDARRLWRAAIVRVPESAARTEQPALKNEDPAHPERVEFAAALQIWIANKALAERVLAGIEQAYLDAVGEFSSLEELSILGTRIDLTVHSTRELEVQVHCNSRDVIPAIGKSLTATGKISEKPLARARRAELHQDHVCSGLLRVARECFAILPIDRLLLTAYADVTDSITGTPNLQAIFSVLIPRGGLEPLDFSRIDPSDAVESFPHAGDFKSSRKADGFAAVQPLRFEDLAEPRTMGLTELLRHAGRTRAALRGNPSQSGELFL